MLSDLDDHGVDAIKSAAEGVKVSQQEVLSRAAWMGRAEAHRDRWGAIL